MSFRENDFSNLLWYDTPAKRWIEALPVGNGHLGGMIYGGVARERIALNHDELWSGIPQDKTVPGAAKVFLQARRLAMQGKLAEATELLESDRFQSTASDAYLPLGELQIDFHSQKTATDALPKLNPATGHQQELNLNSTPGYRRKANPNTVTGYRRGLSLNSATAYVTYKQDGVAWRRTCFASHPANLIVYQVKAGQPFSCHVTLNSPLKNKVTVDKGLLLLHGECPGEYRPNLFGKAYQYHLPEAQRGIGFFAGVRPLTNGAVKAEKGRLRIENATEITLYFTCDTSFRGWDKHPRLEGKEYRLPVRKRLENVGEAGFKPLRQEHLADYRALYDRVKLSLGPVSFRAKLPTDRRLQLFEQYPDDLSLCTLMYNFGRYLAIAGSRPGTQPLNLQGIWNDRKKPMWNSNYTLNINTEMNYWPMLACALPELHEPLLRMIDELKIAGEKTAQVHYQAPGFTVHHNTDLWRFSAPRQGSASWSFWPLGGAWLCRHLWEHYRYTVDESFLRDTAYPVMRKAAEFCLALLVENENGHLIMAPSTSPENVFLYQDKKIPVALTSTMTMTIIRELFENLARCFDILKIEDDFARNIRESLPKLWPLQRGQKGQLLEWNEEFPEAEPHHRHVSHLYALHPARFIDPDRTPELAEACRRTLMLRGDDGTGWSLGWKINFWARLRDGNHALRLIKRQLRPARYAPSYLSLLLKGGTYPNLFDAHPPFQIDGNFGLVSGINEMLLQAPAENELILLPALPDQWQNGSIKGLAAPGNLRIDMEWAQGKLAAWKVIGDTAGLRITYHGESLRKI